MSNSTDFKYGDLVLKCAQCGNIDTIDTSITDGIDLMLFNRHDSFWRFKCTSCGTELELRLIPSKVEDELADEKLQEETTAAETV